MNSTDRENIAQVVNFFWDKIRVEPHSINDKVVSVVHNALSEAQNCSASIDLVPRPTYGNAGAAYKVMQLAAIGKRIASGDREVYTPCKNQMALGHRSAIEMALMGL